MKLESIIVSILTKFYEILAGLWYQISMHKYTKIAQISNHEYVSFHFFFLNNVVDFLSDFRFLEISKRSDAWGEGSEVGTGQTRWVSCICFTLMLINFVFDRPFYKSLHILPWL